MGDGVHTPESVMTTRAPVVLKSVVRSLCYWGRWVTMICGIIIPLGSLEEWKLAKASARWKETLWTFSLHPKDIHFLRKVECCQSLLMHFVSDWWKCAAAPLSIFSLKRSFWHTMDGEYATNDNLNVKIDIYWQTHVAESAQAEYCSTFHCVCVQLSVYRRGISNVT